MPYCPVEAAPGRAVPSLCWVCGPQGGRTPASTHGVLRRSSPGFQPRGRLRETHQEKGLGPWGSGWLRSMRGGRRGGGDELRCLGGAREPGPRSEGHAPGGLNRSDVPSCRSGLSAVKGSGFLHFQTSLLLAKAVRRRILFLLQSNCNYNRVSWLCAGLSRRLSQDTIGGVDIFWPGPGPKGPFGRIFSKPGVKAVSGGGGPG